MVNASKVLKRRSSKRTSLHDKHKIEKKVREHHRKLRRDMRKNPSKHKKKDPGIPNSWPFKAQLIQQQEALRVARQEAAKSAREAKVLERQRLRQAEAAMQAAARMTAQQRRELRRRKAAFAPLNEVLADAEVVLIVLDARDPSACRSAALEHALLECGKLPVLVLNKCDLVPAENLRGWVDHLGGSLPAIPFCCPAQAAAAADVGALATGSGASAAKASAAAQRKPVGKKAKGKEAKAAAAGAEAGTGKGVGARTPIGIDALAALLQLRRRALGGARAASAALPTVTVGVIGFERSGKRSLLRAASEGLAEAEGVRWLTTPAVLMPAVGSGVSANDILLRKGHAEHVPQPEMVVEGILERCERRSLLRHFGVADFEEAHAFLTSFAAQHSLPPPRPLPGSDSLVDSRAASIGFLKFASAGRMLFCTPAPPPPPGGALAALPPSLLGDGGAAKAVEAAAAAVARCAGGGGGGERPPVELMAGAADEIDLEEEEEEMYDGEESGEEGEEEEESGEEEGEEEEESGEEESGEDDEEDDD